MTTDILSILEMAVDGAGIVICLAGIMLFVRSQRLHNRMAAHRQTMAADFSTLMDSRRIGQEAENVFSALFDAVDGQRQRFMAAIDDTAPPSLAEKRAVPAAGTSSADRAAHAPRGHLAPATVALARKIQLRQTACRRN